MDFRIEPGCPDGICIRVEFYEDTWFGAAKLMERLEDIERE